MADVARAGDGRHGPRAAGRVEPGRERAPVDTRRRHASTSAQSSGLLVVEDTGVGLPPEDVPHAFERFYLHDRNPDGRARIGSGLGLAIVKELTERMGGTVSVDSEVGRGTTFVVRLPVDRARIDELEPVASRPS